MIFSAHNLAQFTGNATGTAFDFDNNPGPSSVTVSCASLVGGTVTIEVKNGSDAGSEWISYATHTDDGYTEINAPFEQIRATMTGFTSGTATVNLCWVRN